jgi:hypothetical protein
MEWVKAGGTDFGVGANKVDALADETFFTPVAKG